MTSTIRVSEPRELLALIPHQLGFVPSESVVLVSLREPRSRVGMVARVDLDGLADQEFGPQLARSLVAHLDSDRAGACIVVCYVSAPVHEGEKVPDAVLSALEHIEQAASAFFPIDGLSIVDPNRFHIVGPEFEIMEPGRPLTDLQSTAVGAQMVVAGNLVAQDRAQLGALPAISGRHRRAANAAHQNWSRLRTVLLEPRFEIGEIARAAVELAGTRAPNNIRDWRNVSMRIWRHEVERAGTLWDGQSLKERPSTWGKLAAALEDVVVRDAVLLSLVVGPKSLPELTIGSDGHDDQISAAVSAVMDPSVGEPPKPHVVEPCREVLRKILAYAPRQQHAPAATLLALIAWWEGKGAEASVWLDRALTVDPDYRLAILMVDALKSGMPPGWVRAGQLGL